MLNSRTFNVVWIARDQPVLFNPGIMPHKSVEYTGEELKISKK